MRKQNVIIFSSFKSLEIVRRLCAELNKSNRVNAINWNSCFEAVYTKEYSEQKSYPLFCFLTKRIPSFDFAIVVAGKDDMLPPEDRKNPQDEYRMRDNVIFELGMCCMALGESRVILLRHKNVRLFADLRGNTADLHKKYKNNELHSTPLKPENIQLATFDYETQDDIGAISNDILKCIIAKSDDYAPVIIGAACSTASGYAGNFINAAMCAFNQYANPDPKKGKVELDIPGRPDLCAICKDLTNLDFRILLPSAIAYNDKPSVFSNPRAACNSLYRDPRFGIIPDCHITDSGRKITFACKQVGSKLFLIDIPTTILTSYDTATKILKINDDTPKNGIQEQQQRYITKEIDMFNASLKRLMPPQESTAIKYEIEEIFFNDETDKQNLPWLYE